MDLCIHSNEGWPYFFNPKFPVALSLSGCEAPRAELPQALEGAVNLRSVLQGYGAAIAGHADMHQGHTHVPIRLA